MAWKCRQLAAIALTLAAVSPAAAADPTEQDKALATALFDEGKKLLVAGKVSEACRKLEESRRLDPLPGTILNLAACHEQEGKMASALAELREARALAERDHRQDRVAFAEEHMRAIEPRISSLILVVSREADAPELALVRDGTAIGRAAWGTKIPVDPGAHVIEASAPGKKAWKIEVLVKPDGDVETVNISPLEDTTPAVLPLVPSQPPPSILPMVPPPGTPGAVVRPPRPPPASPPAHGLSTQRVAALATGVAGLVGIGMGTGFGIRAFQLHAEPGAICSASPCTEATSLNNEAKTAADVSTVSFVIPPRSPRRRCSGSSRQARRPRLRAMRNP
jgi:hypothetical protein